MALILYIGGGDDLSTDPWDQIRLAAESGIYISPGEVDDKIAYIKSRVAGKRAHLEVTKGNFRVRDGVLIIKDGITAPAAEAGFLQLYVDIADGELKVIFGDGTVKTLATDT